MKKRKHIKLETKLASALLTIKRVDANGALVPVIPFEKARGMTAKQIISCFRFDHCVIPHAEEGPDEAWNLDPIPTVEHDTKTRKIDTPGIAKRKRVRTTEEEFRRKMLTPRDERPKKKSRWVSRPFPKKRKLKR